MQEKWKERHASNSTRAGLSLSLSPKHTWHSKKLKRHKKREGNKSGSCINIIPSDFHNNRSTDEWQFNLSDDEENNNNALGIDWKRVEKDGLTFNCLRDVTWFSSLQLMMMRKRFVDVFPAFFQSCFSCCHTKWQPQFVFKVCQQNLLFDWEEVCRYLSVGFRRRWWWSCLLFYCLVVWNSRTREWIKRGRWDE